MSDAAHNTVFESVRKHPITFEGAATDFFDGALLGNGSLGAVVRTRPDAVIVHLGHTNVWDIRAMEYRLEELGSFEEHFTKVKAIDPTLESVMDDQWYREYRDFASSRYEQYEYPRPFPCGSLFLFYEKREYEVLGHSLSIAEGVLTIRFVKNDGSYVFCRIFVDAEKDLVYLSASDENGNPVALFNRMRLIPEVDEKNDVPAFCVQNDSVFFQRLPYDVKRTEELAPKDRGFKTYVCCDQLCSEPLQWRLSADKPFDAAVGVMQGLALDVVNAPVEEVAPEADACKRTVLNWRGYWNRSAVALEDEFLEGVWYRNMYFMRCVLSENSQCPGLYGNFVYREFGTAWHSDYHMNYNLQQLFWGCFITNHCELHNPYYRLVEDLVPASKRWARHYFKMPGAYYPHSSYPRELEAPAYPTLDWGWQICETPWAVQSLWWHYTYTGDVDLLREHLFQPIKEAVLFLVAYMTRKDAYGKQWNDDAYHVFPTVSPELYGYGLVPGLSKNYDCIVDLALIQFVFDGYIDAVKVLGLTDEEAETVQACRMILDNFPDYPVDAATDSWVSVNGEDPEIVQNTPNNMVPVFPGEQVDLDSDIEMLERGRRTWRRHRNEGGNDLVFYAMQGARMGTLDLEKFKRQIKYCLMNNGSCTDRCILSGGRYEDDKDFDFMSRMGVWTENFSLCAVVSNCLVHTHSDVIHFFPNWDMSKKAEFVRHLAKGGVEISGACEGGRVTYISFCSQKGADVSYVCPWSGALKTVAVPAGEEIRLMQNEG